MVLRELGMHESSTLCFRLPSPFYKSTSSTTLIKETKRVCESFSDPRIELLELQSQRVNETSLKATIHCSVSLH